MFRRREKYMKVLQITVDYEEHNEWLDSELDGFAVYDEESSLITGYISRFSYFSSMESISYIIGSYDEETKELEFLEIIDCCSRMEDDNLFIFEDSSKEGVWGNCDLKTNYFSVQGKARTYVRETTQRSVRDVSRIVDHLEEMIDDSDVLFAITDYNRHIHKKFSGVFRDYFDNSAK